MGVCAPVRMEMDKAGDVSGAGVDRIADLQCAGTDDAYDEGVAYRFGVPQAETSMANLVEQ